MQRHCCSVRLECREISKKVWRLAAYQSLAQHATAIGYDSNLDLGVQDDDEEKLFLFVQNQKAPKWKVDAKTSIFFPSGCQVMGAQELALASRAQEDQLSLSSPLGPPRHEWRFPLQP